jgi:hypothetical protein
MRTYDRLRYGHAAAYHQFIERYGHPAALASFVARYRWPLPAASPAGQRPVLVTTLLRLARHDATATAKIVPNEAYAGCTLNATSSRTVPQGGMHKLQVHLPGVTLLMARTCMHGVDEHVGSVVRSILNAIFGTTILNLAGCWSTSDTVQPMFAAQLRLRHPSG